MQQDKFKLNDQLKEQRKAFLRLNMDSVNVSLSRINSRLSYIKKRTMHFISCLTTSVNIYLAAAKNYCLHVFNRITFKLNDKNLIIEILTESKA